MSAGHTPTGVSGSPSSYQDGIEQEIEDWMCQFDTSHLTKKDIVDAVDPINKLAKHMCDEFPHDSRLIYVLQTLKEARNAIGQCFSRYPKGRLLLRVKTVDGVHTETQTIVE